MSKFIDLFKPKDSPNWANELASKTTCLECAQPLRALYSRLIYCRHEGCSRFGLVTVITRETPEEKT